MQESDGATLVPISGSGKITAFHPWPTDCHFIVNKESVMPDMDYQPVLKELYMPSCPMERAPVQSLQFEKNQGPTDKKLIECCLIRK